MAAPAPTQEAQSAAEFTHLCTTFSDCIESIPPTITRSISDLRELDAVLSSNLQAMSDKIARLLEMIERPAGDGDPTNTPQHRFSLLREIAEEARSFKPGGEDKIRVATGTCETLIHHTNQLDILANLLSTLLPLSMGGTIPPPTWPHGYPILFATPASASGSAYRKPDYLPTNSQTYGGSSNSARSAGLYTHHTNQFYPANPSLGNGAHNDRHANLYAAATDTVRGYVRDGVPLPNMDAIHANIQAQNMVGPTQSGSQHGHHQSGGGAAGTSGGSKRSRAKDKEGGGGGGSGRSRGKQSSAQQAQKQSNSTASTPAAGGTSGNPALSSTTAPAGHGSASQTGAVPMSATGSQQQQPGGRSREDEPGFIPYANKSRASLDSAADGDAARMLKRNNSLNSNLDSAAGSSYDPGVYSTAGAAASGTLGSGVDSHGQPVAQNIHSHPSTAGDKPPTTKKRRNNKSQQQTAAAAAAVAAEQREGSVSNGGGAAAGDESNMPSPLPSDNGNAPPSKKAKSNAVNSPAATAAGNGNGSGGAGGVKRARSNNKKTNHENSPDAGSPHLAHATVPGAGAKAPKRKASQITDVSDNATVKQEGEARQSRVPGLVGDTGDESGADNGEDEELGDEMGEGEDGDEGEDGQGDERTYCYCDRVSFGNMIGCDGEDCKREWFHLACVGLENPPRGSWYCDECKEKREVAVPVPPTSTGGTKKRR